MARPPSPPPLMDYGPYTARYRGRVLARMEAEGLTAAQMARILEREAIEKAMDDAQERPDGSKVVKPAHRTPTDVTIRNWRRAAVSRTATEAVRLHRTARRVGPLTSDMFAKAMTLVGWDDSTAVERLGARGTSMVRAWREGEVPIPPQVAAHVRTILAVLAGSPPWRGIEGGGVEEKRLGAHSRRDSPAPHTSIEFD